MQRYAHRAATIGLQRTGRQLWRGDIGRCDPAEHACARRQLYDWQLCLVPLLPSGQSHWGRFTQLQAPDTNSERFRRGQFIVCEIVQDFHFCEVAVVRCDVYWKTGCLTTLRPESLPVVSLQSK